MYWLAFKIEDAKYAALILACGKAANATALQAHTFPMFLPVPCADTSKNLVYMHTVIAKSPYSS